SRSLRRAGCRRAASSGGGSLLDLYEDCPSVGEGIRVVALGARDHESDPVPHPFSDRDLGPQAHPVVADTNLVAAFQVEAFRVLQGKLERLPWAEESEGRVQLCDRACPEIAIRGDLEVSALHLWGGGGGRTQLGGRTCVLSVRRVGSARLSELRRACCLLPADSAAADVRIRDARVERDRFGQSRECRRL